MSAIAVTDNLAERRYEATIDGALAGFLQYGLARTRIIHRHTEVLPEFEGEGVGSALARYALDDALSRGLEVVPICPFVAGWIKRHPEYANVVTPPLRAQFEPEATA